VDGAVLTRLRAENAAEVARLDAVVADARENHGVVELGAAVLKKAQYLGAIGDKEGALRAYAAMPDKALSTGGKADIAMACARLAFISGDKKCVQRGAAQGRRPRAHPRSRSRPLPVPHPPPLLCAGSWWSAWQRPRR
jgi:hypothetical protein